MSEIKQSMADDAPTSHDFELKKSVAMVGMMGAGKTAVGRAVAQRLGVPFIDSDAELEAAANLTIPEIFERDGEAFFRKRETEVISRLLTQKRCILSTGGGAFMAQINRQNISERGVSLWLDAELPLLWQRVRHKETRPLLRTRDPLGTLTEIYQTRKPIYAQADLRVPCSASLSIEAMAERVIEVLQSRKDVLEGTDA